MTSLSTIQAPKSLRFMWMDSWCDRAARQNPLRWNTCTSATDLLHKLTAQGTTQSRPVRIYVEMPEGNTEKEFKDIELAMNWIRGRFPCKQSENAQSTSGRASALELPRFAGLFGNCTSAPSVSADSDVIGVDAKTIDPTEDPLVAMDIPDDASVCSALDGHNDGTVTLRFMWADAGILPISAMRNLAQANPLRWSSPKSPREVMKTLEQAQLYWPARPVTLESEMPGEHTVSTFENVEKAVLWIREEFRLPEEVEVTQEEHRCVICLDAKVSVMLMPCRHAVLCDDCAVPMLAGREPCPICRTPIENHARGQFASDYVDLIEAMEARMEGAATSVHTGMYNHVKPLMLTGALLGTGAAVCFVAFPPAAPVLAAGAFAVGYVPWFATTVVAFEQEDHSANQAHRFFSREDLSRPLKLIGKIVAMAVVAPVAAVAFFIPYGLYRGVLKPALRALLHGLVRVSAFAHVYAARPTGQALQALGSGLVQLVQLVGGHIQDLAFMLGDMLVSVGAGARDLLMAIARFLHDYALMPCVHGAQYAGECIAAQRRATYNNVLLPVAHGIATGATAIYDHALVPSGQAIHRVLQAIGNLISRGGMFTYDYVLVPGGRGVVLVVRSIADGIVIGAEACYSYFLLPCSQFAVGGLKMLGKGLATSAELLFQNVLVPLGQATLRALRMLGNGIVATAGFFYRNAVVPVCCGVGWTLRSLANALTFGATSIYTYVLTPCGRALALTAKGIAGAGSMVIQCLASAAAATYSGVLVPLAGALASGASAVYVCALAPCGRALCTASLATAAGIAAVARAAAHYGTMGAQLVYVYILLPCGQVVAVVFATTGEVIGACATATGGAVRACSQEVTNAAIAARCSARQAVTQTGEVLLGVGRA